MKYADWNNLNEDEKKNLHWRHHPRIRIATIFSVLFAIAFAVIMLRVLQNRRIHVNRKPNAKEAFAIAKAFVKDKVRQPGSAAFPKNNFRSIIDTANNSYNISSTVNQQDSSGKFVKTPWQVKLAYTGGDWADKSSWKLVNISLEKQSK
ncbi:hypothetical protein FFF34_007190 [Inquilinus sp. KBS0705]|nr:hypothetical protein FFF34_007190 [Inquilinus sp. KBS0705]